MKDRFDFLTDSIKSRGWFRGNVYLFKADDAISVILEAKKANKKFLGFDGFIVDGQKIQPDQDHSMDFTNGVLGHHLDGPYCSGDEYEYGIQFIWNRRSLGLYFELVFGD